MAGIKNKEVCKLLKKWLSNSGTTQSILANRYKVTQPVISKQLSGQESIPIERIQDIIDITNPPPKEIDMMNRYLKNSGNDSYLRDKTGIMRALINAYGDDLLLMAILWNWKDVTCKDVEKYILPMMLEIRSRPRNSDDAQSDLTPEDRAKYFSLAWGGPPLE